MDIGLEPMKTVLLFFLLDDDDPVLQVGLELRDYESENGRKQSFSYDVSWTQLRSDIVLWFMFKHLKQYHRLQIWYICISLKTYFEKSSGGNYKCQKRRVLNMDYGQYAILSKDLTQLRYPERDTIVNNLIFKKKKSILGKFYCQKWRWPVLNTCTLCIDIDNIGCLEPFLTLWEHFWIRVSVQLNCTSDLAPRYLYLLTSIYTGSVMKDNDQMRRFFVL